jgi:hypothetical protein
VLTLSWGGAGRWIGGGGGLPVGGYGGGAVRCREGCGGSVGEVWGGEGVVLALYRRRRSVPGQNISPATSTPAPAGWAAVVGLDWRCDCSGEVTYRPVGGSTRAGEGLGRPWWQRRQPGGAVRRDGSSRGVMAAKPRPGWLAGTGDQARRGPAVA